MLSLQEARQFYTEDELNDQELVQLVEEIDTVQCQILDDLMGGGAHA